MQTSQKYTTEPDETNKPFYIKFTLDDSSNTPLLLDFPTHGIFDILIRPTQNHSGTYAKFLITNKVITRLVSSIGNDKEQLDMSKTEDGVNVFYNKAPNTNTFTEYIMKVTTL